MRRGITPVIAIILLLLLAVAMTGGMYFFYQAYKEDVEDAGDEGRIFALKNAKTDIKIASAKDGVVYIRNVGEEEIATQYLALYIDERPTSFTTADSTLLPGDSTSLLISNKPSCSDDFCQLKLTGATNAIGSVKKEELGCQALSNFTALTASTVVDYNEMPSVSSGTGFAGIAWEYDGPPGGDDDIWFRKITGSTLSSVVEVTSDFAGGIDDRNPALTIASSTSYFAWRRNNPSFLVNTTNYTSFLSTNQTISSPGVIGSLDLALYGSQTGLVYSDLSGDYDLYFSQGSPYSSSSQLTNTDYWETNPRISYGNTKGLIVYQVNLTGTDYDIQYIEGPSWGNPENLTTTAEEEQNPDVDFFGNKAMVVWQQTDSGDYDIYYSVYDGYSFSSPTKIAAIANDDTKPRVSWITQNRAVVFFMHDDGSDSEIYKAEYSEGVWSVNPVTDNAYEDENPDVDFNSDCYGVVAWDADDSGKKIRYHVFN
jgi:hypothetical protein